MISIHWSKSQFPVYHVITNEITLQAKLQIEKALQVYQLQLCNPKMTQAKACANVGIDAKTYRKWIATQEDTIAKLEKTRQEIERNELASILES